MNVPLFLLILRARIGLLSLAVVATLIAAAVVTMMLPRSYRATASLLLDGRDVQTQVEILNSQKVARRVVDSLKLAERPAMRSEFSARSGGNLTVEDRLAGSLTRSLHVETSQSNVLQVSYDSPNAADAAAIATAFAQAYMDTTEELRVAPSRQAADRFDEQLQMLRENLRTAQQKLDTYQREHGIVTTSEGLDEEQAKLASLSTQLARTMDQNIDLASREALARSAVDSGASLDSPPAMRDDSAIQELRFELREGEAKLQSLMVKFGENHPEVRRQVGENNSVRSSLNAEMSRVANLATGRRQEGEQRAARLIAALAAQRARLLELKDTRDGLAVLLRDVDSAQSAYDTAVQSFTTSQVESRASYGNATLLNPAAIPRQPRSPNIPLNMALAGIAGIVLGLGLVLIREMTDRRVHSPRQLAEATGVPLLGELIAWTPTAVVTLAGPRNALRSIAHRGWEHT